MPDHPHPASVTPSRSPAISESPPRPPAPGRRAAVRRAEMHAQPGCERRVHTPRYTPRAEVHLRYICALTSRYASWRSQREHGRRAGADGRRAGSGRPSDGATWPRSGAGRRQDGRVRRIDIKPGVPNTHTAPGAITRLSTPSSRSPKRHDPTQRRASSRNMPPARPVRGRPWNSRRCAPTVLGHGSRPLYVRGHRDTAVHSATR